MYNVYGDKILRCKKRHLHRVNQNEKFSKILIFYAHKTEGSTQMKVYTSHTESRKEKVKEFEKPNFACFIFEIYIFWLYKTSTVFAFLESKIKIESGRGKDNPKHKNSMLNHNIIKC